MRTVERAEWIRRGDHLDFEITADSFLRYMVRTLVGTMLESGPDAIAPLLERRAARRGREDGAAVGALPRLRRLLTDRSIGIEFRRNEECTSCFGSHKGGTS